jgi:hypothetical protein
MEEGWTPPLDPGDPGARLLRAIFGLCPDCDRTDEHSHPCRVCGESTDDYHIHEEGPS